MANLGAGMKIKCIALDFDFTLAHFLDPVERGLFNIFRRRRVAEVTIKKAYDEAVKTGFTIQNFTEQIKNLTMLPEFDPAGDNIPTEFEAWLRKSLKTYPDAMPFLWKWWGKIPIVILTHGNQFYQRQKINAARIPYDKLVVMAPSKRKAAVIHDLVREHDWPILFLEDKPDELDAVIDEPGLNEDDVTTVLVCREDSPYYGKQTPRHNHVRVHSLDQVNFLIEEGV
ncbi:MAG: hypothetical protein Q7R94_02580 [bacterium]|nr:hypothetical protein [bacterium]